MRTCRKGSRFTALRLSNVTLIRATALDPVAPTVQGASAWLMLQELTDLDENATVVSVDGAVDHNHQGEGGKQCDALMPMLFSLGQHEALEAISGRLLPEERLFAYLDDLHVVCQPARVAEVHTAVREELWRCAKISLHRWKTKVWNCGGTCPDACQALTEAARLVNPRAVVWRGDPTLPRHDQGLSILGTPMGGPAFILAELEKKSTAFTCRGSRWLRTGKRRGCC